MRTSRGFAPRVPVVAIVGSGFSGTMVAVNLARRAGTTPLKIVLIERGERFARGAAYGTTSPHHLLNVAAGHMSALPDQPGHFLEWLRSKLPGADAGTFAPRRLYGEYLEDLLTRHLADSPVSVARVRDEIIDLRETHLGVILHGRDGSRTRADHVVLALGHAKPAPPVDGASTPFLGRAYAENPWTVDPLEGLAADDPMILVGSGLTAVDAILDAHARGHRGRLTAISRHGLLPCRHERFAAKPVTSVNLASPLTVRAVFRHFRDEAARIERGGGDWRGVFESLRGDFPALWSALDGAEKARFLRHAAPIWDVHRHRMAPEAARKIDELRSRGQLDVIAGRLRSIEAQGDRLVVTFVRRGHANVETFTTPRVINCTGPARRIAPCHSPLVGALFARGLAIPDPLSLGLMAGVDGAILNASGERTGRLFGLGPILKGARWETTAVRELRSQAYELAGHILKRAASVTAMRGRRVA